MDFIERTLPWNKCLPQVMKTEILGVLLVSFGMNNRLRKSYLKDAAKWLKS